MKSLTRGARSMRTYLLGLAIIVLMVQSVALVSATQTVQTRNQMQAQSKYAPHFPIDISGDSDFKVYGFPGNGTPENPFLIQGLNMSYGGLGIEISDTQAYFIISNCIVNLRPETPIGSSVCINLQSAENGIIENCWLEGSDRLIQMQSCENMQILNNTCVQASSTGVLSDSGYRNYIANNTIVNDQCGILISNGFNSTISDNKVYANSICGLTLESCHNDTVESNFFGWNGLSSLPAPQFMTKANVLDNWSSDIWMGNHYSDYSGSGLYEIYGNANATDTEPVQLVDTTRPQMNSPDSVTIPSDAEELKCNFTEDYPLTYSAYIGNDSVAKGYWFDDSVSVPLSLFHGENASVTIHLVDGAQNSASFTVQVQIQKVTSTIPVDITPIVYTAVAVVGVVAIVIALEFHRRRKS